MKNLVNLIEFLKIFSLILLMSVGVLFIVGCSKQDNQVLVPIKPNLPKIEKAKQGINAYGSLINILKELDNRRAVEESYNKL